MGFLINGVIAGVIAGVFAITLNAAPVSQVSEAASSIDEAVYVEEICEPEAFEESTIAGNGGACNKWVYDKPESPANIDMVFEFAGLSADDEVEVYEFADLTAETIVNRNGKIIIEIIRGTCVGENGEGITDEGYYITYAHTPGFQVGARYESYCIYNPATDFIDDIIERYDFCIASGF